MLDSTDVKNMALLLPSRGKGVRKCVRPTTPSEMLSLPLMTMTTLVA